MPIILTGTGTVTTPPVTPGGRRHWTLTVADRVGNSITADTQATLLSPYRLRPGITGIDMPPVNITTDPLIDDHGSAIRSIRFVERDIFLPIWVQARTFAEVRRLSYALLRLLNPAKYPDPRDQRNLVDVTVADPDGSQSVASGYYVGGAEGSYTDPEYGVEWRAIGATIRCLDPFFYGPQLVQAFPRSTNSKPLLANGAGFFPIRLGSTSINSTVTVNNPSDVDSYPVWFMPGPGQTATATSQDTGESWTVTGAIPAGGSVTVDTRPNRQAVTDQDGGNALTRFTGSFWPLHPGPNTVTLTVDSVTSTTPPVLCTVPVKQLGA